MSAATGEWAQPRGRTGRKTGQALLFGTILFLTFPAKAQTAASEPIAGSAPTQLDAQGSDIVVTGERNREAIVRAFVGGVTIRTGEQIARFAHSVCPASFGLPEAFNATVVSRVRDIARDAGIRVAPPGCRPNIVIITAERGRDLLVPLRRQRPALFAGLEVSQLREIDRAEGPVRAWQIVEQRGGDGQAIESISYIQKPDGSLMYIGRSRHLAARVASRLERPTRLDLELSIVVFDLEALEGVSLAQIADHAAMRSLARTDPEAAPSGRTILALFSDLRANAIPAVSLTRLDRAYLRAIYATNNRLGAQHQQSDIVRAAALDLTAADREFDLR